MLEIRNDDMLRFVYELLADCKRENRKPEKIADVKRAIRAYYRKQDINAENARRVFADNDDYVDSYTELMPVPFGAEIYKEEWFDSEVRRTYIPSQYDCTGQHFTISYRFVRFRGRLYCIHHVGIDV